MNNSDTSHYENVPFEVPEGWCWTTIEDLLINRDSERIPLSLAVRNKQHKKEYNYYGAAGVIDKVEGYLFSERLLLIGEDGANLLSRAKDNAFFADGKYWVNNHAHVLDCSEKEVLTYVALVINSMALDPYVTGSAQPKLSQDNLNKILIPLPPLAEQRRIIYAINNYSGYLSNIENDKESIEHIIDLLKQLILNLAITGKLVSQELNDEPAIELLKRINPSFVPADNRHYENIPQNWEECALKDIVEIQNGFAFKSSLYSNDGVRVIRITNVQDGYIVDDSPKYYPLSLMTGLDDYILEENDLLMSLTGNVGRVAMMPVSLLPAALNQRVCCIKPKSSEICREFIFYLFRTESFLTSCIESGKGVAQLNVSTEWLKNYRVALPPKEEQRRIVKAVQNIMTQIDEILAEL